MSILPFPLVRPPVERLFSAGVLHLNQPPGIRQPPGQGAAAHFVPPAKFPRREPLSSSGEGALAELRCILRSSLCAWIRFLPRPLIEDEDGFGAPWFDLLSFRDGIYLDKSFNGGVFLFDLQNLAGLFSESFALNSMLSRYTISIRKELVSA